MPNPLSTDSSQRVFRLKVPDRFKENPTPENDEVRLSPPKPSENDPQARSEPEKPADNGTKEIIIKGPLGHAYTEMLNHLLNRKTNRTGVIRSEAMSNFMSVLSEEELRELTPSGKHRAYVFVNDGKKMSLTDVDNALTEATKLSDELGETGYVSMLVENLGDVEQSDPSKAGYIADSLVHMESRGVRISYTKEGAARSIMGYLGL